MPIQNVLLGENAMNWIKKSSLIVYLPVLLSV